jgi:hypothetical protein
VTVDRIRVIFSIEGGREIRVGRNEHIVREASYFKEYDVKFNSIDEALAVAREAEYPELCFVLGNDEKSTPENILKSAIGLMTEERYWLAHEYMEKLWKRYPQPTSSFFHSLVLFCVAMVHHQMKRYDSESRIYENSVSEFSRFHEVEKENAFFSYPLPDKFIKTIEEYGILEIRSSRPEGKPP